MQVPKATVYEDSDTSLREDNIWTAWQVFSM